MTQMMVPPGVMRAESLAEGGAHTEDGSADAAGAQAVERAQSNSRFHH